MTLGNHAADATLKLGPAVGVGAQFVRQVPDTAGRQHVLLAEFLLLPAHAILTFVFAWALAATWEDQSRITT